MRGSDLASRTPGQTNRNMTTIVRTTLLLALTLLISACKFNQPTGDLYARAPTPPAGQAQLVVYRPQGKAESRVYSLNVDGVRKASMLNGGYSIVALPPGPHALETSPDFTILAWLPGIIIPILPIIIYGELIADTTASVELKLVAGETKYVHCRLAESKLEVQSAEAANAALRMCRAQ
jgi:hypothetical protein